MSVADGITDTEKGAAYGTALDALDGGAIREIRIVEAAE